MSKKPKNPVETWKRLSFQKRNGCNDPSPEYSVATNHQPHSFSIYLEYIPQIKSPRRSPEANRLDVANGRININLYGLLAHQRRKIGEHLATRMLESTPFQSIPVVPRIHHRIALFRLISRTVATTTRSEFTYVKNCMSSMLKTCGFTILHFASR